MDTIYIEKHLLNHPRAKAILQRCKPKRTIECENYREVFNPKTQNFRLQKQHPALIIAEKAKRLVLATPEGFGIGADNNYYFSHMLNCVYDCRYCFLQGMFSSANQVIFINYEDFMAEIVETVKQHEGSCYFFSGYDCDSLAYEHVTHFLECFLPFFSKHPQAILECRTKSVNIRQLLSYEPIANAVIAFSFTPQLISDELEHGVPSVAKRLQAIKQLATQGWQIGLRFDPLIYHERFNEIYRELIDDIFEVVLPDQVHSISVGPLRFPEKMYHKIVKLYPYDPLLRQPVEKRNKHYALGADLEAQMKENIFHYLKRYLTQSQIFECHVLS